jgi:putative DNA primase/helicase
VVSGENKHHFNKRNRDYILFQISYWIRPLKYTPNRTRPWHYLPSLQDVFWEFKAELNHAGFVLKAGLIADGCIHRFHVKGDRPGSKNGWYVLYPNGIGVFGSWKTDEKHIWRSDGLKTLSRAEKRRLARQITEAQRQRRIEQERKQTKARDLAHKIWRNAAPAPADHPYLFAKQVKSHGLRIKGNALIMPLLDTCGVIHSVQYIYPDTSKHFLTGGRIKGCFYIIGDRHDELIICEGFSTGASLHEHMGHDVAVAINAGNLLPVAHALRAKYPAREIIIAADNDDHLEKNIGVIKATEAARAIGTSLIIPPVSGDFNDYLRGEYHE